MRKRWPEMWDSNGKEKLAMACGGCSRRPKVTPPPPQMVARQVPDDSVVLMEYLGPAPASTFIGKSTGQKYRFGSDPNHKRKLVYKADVPGFLAFAKLFQVIPTNQPAPELPTNRPTLVGVSRV